MKKITLIIVLSTLIGATTFGQTTRYVKTTSSGLADGSSWANASADLQAMINASSTNDEIWVAAGTHTPNQESDGTTDDSRSFTFYIAKDNIKIYGGFNGTESTLSERNVSNNVTILSGDIGTANDNSDNVYHVVYIDGRSNSISANTVLDGLTITKGNANGSNPDFDGGGVFINGDGSGLTTQPTISNCIFSDNNAGFTGGGAFIYTAQGTVSPIFNHCIFKNNTAALGGAVTIYSPGTSSSSFNNCLFYNNSVTNSGGAIFNSADNGTHNPSFTNCTFASNSATSTGGVYFDRAISGTGQTTMTNCILWSNGSTPFAEESGTTTDFVINYSVYDDGTVDGTINLPSHITGANNLDADPLFTDLANGDLTITNLTSPAFNSGDNTAWTATGLAADIIGNFRPHDGTVDLGVYELNSFSSTDYFITTWKTTAPNESITIPTTPFGTYDYFVDWGDGSTSTNQTGDATHTYAVADTYTVKIYYDFPQLGFFYHNGTSANKILTVEQWGTIKWTSMSGAFYFCSNLQIDNSIRDVPDLTNVQSLAYMFGDCSNLNGGNLDTWDVSNVLTTQNMFSGATSFNQPLNSWVVSNVTDISSMFGGATSFNQPLDNWNVSSVTNMANVFGGATSFNQSLGSWNISNLTSLGNMLDNCGMDITNYDNTLIGWAAQNVQSGVELGATGLKYCNGSTAHTNLSTTKSWNIVGDAIDCTINKLSTDFVTTWKTDNSGNSNSTSVTIFTTGSGYNYSIDWNNDGVFENTSVTGNITHDYGTAGTYTIRIRGDFPQLYFGYGGDRLKLVSLDQWGNISWSSLGLHEGFDGCTNMVYNATDAPDLTTATSLASLFSGVTTFNGNMSSWSTNNIDNMHNMFGGATGFNLDISSWNTSKVVDMSDMFNGATSFNQNISSWSTSFVTFMNNMFKNATAFNQNISGWTTGSVSNMSYMFSGATAFNQNISGWTTSGVTNMSYMFSGATAFNQNLGNWSISLVSDMSGMLDNSGLDVTNYDNTLIGWESQSKSGLSLGASGLKYCNGTTARTSLTTTYSWNISSDAVDCTINKLSTDFVTTWKTDNSGNSNSTSLTIFTSGSGYSYSVDWNNDGVFDNTSVTGNITHDYGVAGTYTVRIRGDFPKIYFGFGGDRLKLVSLDQWGNISWSSQGLHEAFDGCSNMVYNATDAPDLTNVYSLAGMFVSVKTFNGNMSNWITTNVGNMYSMFANATNFNLDISSWNTGNVVDMSYMFEKATAFNQNISGWNTAKANDMSYMFKEASSFNQNLGNWSLSQVTNMTGMLNSSGLDRDNYDNTLIGWESQSKSGMTLGASGLKYCNSSTQRTNLTTTLSWMISDDVLDCSPLPVELLSFTAEKEGNNIRLTWQTATEINNSHFDVEWSTDGINFQKIGEVAGARTTTEVQFYDFLHDLNLVGLQDLRGLTFYYRLKQVDFDGKFEYTDIIQITIQQSSNSTIKIFPNPAAHYLKIESEDLIGEIVQVFNINGQLVKEFQHQAALTNLLITNLPNGTYFIKVGQEVKKLIVQK